MATQGLDVLLAAVERHGEGSAVDNEVINVMEQAVCAMCEAIGDEAPDDELDAKGMAALLREMADAALERERQAAEALRRAEDEAREKAEAAEAARRASDEVEKKRVAEIEAAPVSYGGFSWGASFEDPSAAATGIEDARDMPRIVELDDD